MLEITGPSWTKVAGVTMRKEMRQDPREKLIKLKPMPIPPLEQCPLIPRFVLISTVRTECLEDPFSRLCILSAAFMKWD